MRVIYEQVLMAGFGGQGILTCGQILAVAAMKEGKHVTWVPSYGPEQRGGTANCLVTVADRPIGSPLMEKITGALIFNQPSLDKFSEQVMKARNLIINSDLVKVKEDFRKAKVFRIPGEEVAEQIGSRRVVNMVLLGAFVALSGIVSMESVKNANFEFFGIAKQQACQFNLEALAAGEKLAEKLAKEN